MKVNFCLSLPLAIVALSNAHEFEGSNTNSCGPGFREDLQHGIVLTATSNAPVGASGRAQIIAVDNNGTNTALLFVRTRGLTNGQCNATVTDVGGSNTYNLGSLNVSTPTGGRGGHGDGDHGDGDNGGWHGSDGEHHDSFWSDWVGRHWRDNSAFKNLIGGGGTTNRFYRNAFHWFTNCLHSGSGSFVLPPALTAANVGAISISDAGGAVYLTGDFTGVTNSTSIYIETVGLVPGTATNVQGQASVTLISSNGKTTGTFKLTASGLEPREKLYLTANETNTFRVFTSRSGTLNVNYLPRTKVVNLQTVVATDVSSNIVFSVSF